MAFKTHEYGVTLRAIGAWLDELHPTYFSVVETPNGLNVVAMLGTSGTDISDTYFPSNELARQWEALVHRRGAAPSADSSIALFPTGRQDFLHALGAELDESGAESLLIDQYDDAIFLSYAYLDPKRGFSWRKRMIILDVDAISTITKVARTRRRPVEATGFLGGLLRHSHAD